MADRRWLKGNLHTHTNRSDGDSDPEVVARWYARHGYDFLVLSDHNHLTILEAPQERRRHWPLLIPGEEVTLMADGKPVHVNGIGVTRLVEPVLANDVVEAIQANVDAIVAAGGLAQINHPNYQWAFDHQAIAQVRGATFMEVFNAHHKGNSRGGGGHPSTEEQWDHVLSAGIPIYGTATDDTHHLKGEFSPDRANPGRAWICVEAVECSQEAILDAMTRGRFYASTGVVLEDVEAGRDGVAIRIRSQPEYLRYTTRVIGKGGRILATSYDTLVAYEPKGDEGYVRMTVTASHGAQAWTQPVFLR